MAKHDDSVFSRIAGAAARWSGSTTAFILAATVIAAWLISGPFFHFSDTWQLVINTSTTIITFLMVFLIQRSQNKDSLAVQLKLNELVAAIDHASNRLISVEDLTEKELDVLHAHYRHLASQAAGEMGVDESHSLQQATARHEHKRERRRGRS